MKVAVIGGGIVGLAAAHQLLHRYPGVELLLLEKEAGPGRHQSGHNSGVLHAGLYYKPGSVRARLAVSGLRRMLEFCREHQIPHDQCGKIVVATREEEIPRLRALLERGRANGLEGLTLLRAEQIHEIEPHAAGIEAIRVPQEGIVDYPAVCEAMAKDIGARGGEVRFSSKVTGLRQGPRWIIEARTPQGEWEHEADFLINCAGLQCDRVSRMAGNRDSTQIVPFRGEYFQLRPERQYLVRNLIYPVPDPSLPFLGVHCTRLIHGGVEVGPNAVLALAREGYRRTDFSLRDTLETLAYRGFWRFFLKHPRLCWDELKPALSRELFVRSLQRLVPDLRSSDLIPGGSGVRAQALSPQGDLVQDFCFVRQRAALHVLSAPSPAATASLAIADHIVDELGEVLPG